MKRELDYLGQALADPKRPFVAILGGSKISGKIDVIQQLLPKVDALLIGGAMACTFFAAMGLEVGRSLVEPDKIDLARDLIDSSGTRLILPHDAMVARTLDDPGSAHAVGRSAIPADEAMYDIGPRTAESYSRAIAAAKTVVWNGPMGVFEKPPFDAGTRAIAQAMARATAAGATTIVGGGDSAAAVAEAGLDRPNEPRLDWRRRVARVPRGEGAARRGGARRRVRRPVFAANWKMNHGPEAARGFMREFAARYEHRGDRDIIFFPSALSLAAARDAVGPTAPFRFGVQNIYYADKGAFTGENAASMAKGAGADFVLVGHSERRHVFGETNEETALKCAAAERAGLVPILCVGETLEQRDADETDTRGDASSFASGSRDSTSARLPRRSSRTSRSGRSAPGRPRPPRTRRRCTACSGTRSASSSATARARSTSSTAAASHQPT